MSVSVWLVTTTFEYVPERVLSSGNRTSAANAEHHVSSTTSATKRRPKFPHLITFSATLISF
jgi:phosphoheptose isomerase